jgi:hypothetical protein
VVRHFDGAKWTGETSGSSVNLRGVWSYPGGDVWAVGDGGTILRRSKVTP